MKTRNSLRRSGAQDCTLCWTMRVVGIMLAATALVFMTQDIFTSKLSMWFFGVCIGLGVITVVTSFMPGPARVHLHDRPILQPVIQPPAKHRKAA